MKKLLLLAFSILSINLHSQEFEVYDFEQNTLQAFEFIITQNATLRQIAVLHPNLKPQVAQAETAFNKRFGKAQANIEERLSNAYTEDEYSEMLASLPAGPETDVTSKKNAEDYLKTVTTRAENNTLPHLKALLSYQYTTAPEGEFLSGHTQVFSTKGMGKFKNTDISLKLPISWVQENDEDNDKGVAKFAGELGTGDHEVMVIIRENILMNMVNNEERKKIFGKEGAKEFIPERAQFVNHTPMEFDGIPGCSLEYTMTEVRDGFTIHLHFLSHIFVYKGRMNFIQCSTYTVGDEEDQATAADKMEHYRALFQLVGKSIKLDKPVATAKE